MEKKLIILFSIFIFCLFILFELGFAQGGVVRFQNPLKYDNFYDLIDALINLIFTISIFIAPLMIIIGAFYILTAGVDPKNIDTGKKIIIYTIVGFVIIIMANGIVDLLRGLFLRT